MHLRKPDQDTEGRLAEALNNPVVTENAYQTQVRNLREQAKNDPNYFYTYSPEFMSLSVDPYNIAEVKRQNDEDHKSKFTVKEGFHNVIKRDFKVRVRPDKYLPESTVEHMRQYPYHEEKAWV